MKISEFFRRSSYTVEGMNEVPEDENGLAVLPVRMHPERERFEEAGFCFYKRNCNIGGRINNKMVVDTVMCLAKLPYGWKVGKHISKYHYFLEDEQGNKALVYMQEELGERAAQMVLL